MSVCGGDGASPSTSSSSTGSAMSMGAIRILSSREGYSTWKFKMRFYLLHEQLWEAVVGYPVGDKTQEATKKRKDELALAKICMTLDGGAITHVRSAYSAKAAWQSLQDAYEDKGMGRRLALERQLYRYCLDDYSNIEEYINAVMNTAQDLADIGKKIDDTSLAAIILGGLTPKYDPLIMALENCNIEVTTAMVKTKLLNEMAKAKSTDESALRTKKVEPRPKKEKKREVICFECNVPGHIRKDCPKRKNKTKKKEDSTLVTALSTNGNNDSWFIDSGATSHMTSRSDWLSELKSLDSVGRVTVANGEGIDSVGIGNVSINTTQGVINNISDVVLVPELKTNLISVKKAVEKGYCVVFDKTGCNLYNSDQFSFKGESILHGSERGGLYTLDCTVNKTVAFNVHSDSDPIDLNDKLNDEDTRLLHSFQLWHKRMGHLCSYDMNQLKNGRADGIQYKAVDKEPCVACIEGKQARKPFAVAVDKPKSTRSLLELIHSDVCGPMSEKSFQGKRYALFFIDDFSRLTFVYFLASKTEVKAKFIAFQSLVERQTGIKIKTLRTDCGTEYLNEEFSGYLKTNGIVHQTSVPYSPQQNGVSERSNRTIVEKARCMLAGSLLSKAYWQDAIEVATYLKNRSPHRAVDGLTPYEKWYGTKPDLCHLRVFGCRAMVHIPDCQRKKLDVKAQQLTFVGYSENPGNYYFRDPCYPRRLIKARDIVFFEDAFCDLKGNNAKVNQAEDPPAVMIFSNIKKADDKIQDPDASGSGGPNNVNKEVEHTVEPEYDTADEDIPENEEDVHDDEQCLVEEPVLTEERYPLRNRLAKDKGLMTADNDESDDPDEPGTFREAMRSSDKDKWVSAMIEEYKSLMKLHTWELVDRPDQKVIPCKWVYKVKKNAHGNITKYKARLVAKGYSQTCGVDYFETFAPVVRNSSLRTLFALAAKLGMKMRHLDVDTAFLNGELEEEVYMHQPEGFAEPGQRNKVCLLKKSLYGLKQAPRAWNLKLNQTLSSLGFKRTPSEPCVYTKLFGTELVILAVYVDDIIVFHKSDKLADVVKSDLQSSFSIKDIGSLSYYLGLNVIQNDGCIQVSQTTFINNVLKKFNMLQCSKAATPLQKVKLQANESGDPSSYPFRSLIGSLMYVAVNTRPDIAYATSYLSQFLTKFDKTHWLAAKRVLQYLKGTIDYCITYTKSNETMIGLADSDWANDNDRRSYSGLFFTLSGGPISWESKKQCIVALSSTEAEYMALTVATKEAIFLQRFIREVTGESVTPVTLFNDSQSAHKLVLNPVHHNRTKHIDTRFHFIREKVADGTIVIKYVPTADMYADILTKPLGRVNHYKCVLGLGLLPG